MSLEIVDSASALAPFQVRDFRRLFTAVGTSTMAGRALAVVLGYQVYELTHDTRSLGILGLVEAIPAISLALYGGHVADRYDLRKILRITMAVTTIGTGLLAVLERFVAGQPLLYAIYALVFLVGVARGFNAPAAVAMEGQIVPRQWLVRSSTLMAGCWNTAAMLGQFGAAFAFNEFGAPATYAVIAGLNAVAWLRVWRIKVYKPRPIKDGETVWESVRTGVRFVTGSQVMSGAMALDMFAVLFGGAIALLPVFSQDILRLTSSERGILQAAPTAGALLTMLWAAHRPPVRRAGRNLFAAVVGFGIAMIVFALSTSFVVSTVALFVSGVCDGVSVVIRRAIMRLLSPDELRGRIAAVNMIFIGSSNELGALESGFAADLLGTVRSVWLGGIATLVVAGVAAVLAPRLRNLNLQSGDEAKLAASEAAEDAGKGVPPSPMEP